MCAAPLSQCLACGRVQILASAHVLDQPTIVVFEYFKQIPGTGHLGMSLGEYNPGTPSISVTWCLCFGIWVLPSSGVQIQGLGLLENLTR